MKFTFIFWMVFVVQLSASVYSPAYAQPAKLKVEFKEATIKEVIDEIEKQTDLTFFFSGDVLNTGQTITLKVRNTSVDEILDLVSEQTGLSITIVRDQILVKKNLPAKDVLFQQPKTVSGKVTDSGGQPLPGVTVVLKGTTQGTVTNADGEYSLNNIPADATLQFSFVGMKIQEILVAGKANINVTMEEETVGIEEVVAIGYGTQKKINITGSVDVVSSEMLENRASSNMSQALQGQLSGIDFSISGRDGYQPGAEMNMDIRGIGSLNGGSPYVLIDGFEGNMNSLNPGDVESVTVLKDAAASAIYGARAPYGVILITTKSGKKNQKFSATYNGRVSLVTPAPLPPELDSYTFARVLNEGQLNYFSTYAVAPETIDRIIAYQNGDYDYIASTFPDNFPVEQVKFWDAYPLTNGWWASNLAGHANNDYWDMATGSDISHSHNFNIQGGSEKTAYYVALGYLDQASTLEWGDDYFKRGNVIAKINTEITDWWDFSYETRFMKSQRHYPNAGRLDNDDTYNILFHILHNTGPLQPFTNSFGNWAQSNVRNFFEAGFNNNEKTENWQTFKTEIRPVQGWKINADFAYQSWDYYSSRYSRAFREENWITGELSGAWVNSEVLKIHSSDYYWTTNAYTSYERRLNEMHNFFLMAGMQYETGTDRNLRSGAKGLIVPDIVSLQTATGVPTVQESLGHWATEGFFGRFSYNYKEKYLFESNVRYDGTSRFLEGNRWGFFPSFSAGWVVSKENFWKQIIPVINTLKIRGSWGELGNQQVAAYQDLALIPISKTSLDWLPNYNAVGQIGYTQTPTLVSQFLTWETASTTNFGLNAGFLDQKLQIDFDWYERNTTDMIGPAEAKPGVLGADVPRSNNASLRTRGFELVLKWKQNLGNALSYFVNLNLYDAKSVVTKFNNPTGILSTWREGQQIDEIWGWSALGLFQTQEEIDAHVDQSYIYNVWNTGDVKYEDLNDDGKIDMGSNTVSDPGDRKIIGYSAPHYQYGIFAGLNYKGFDFSMLWKGTAKRDYGFTVDTGTNYYGWKNAVWSHPKKDQLDYYRDQPGTKYVGLYEGEANINTDAYYARPYTGKSANAKNFNINSRYLANYAYIKLQNVQLGYTFPKSFSSKMGLQNLKVYFTGENLIRVDHLPKGLDAQSVAGSYKSPGKDYRPDRIYSLGVTVTY
ncbi:TonB-dependent receptor [Mariniphaga sediminis]|nr:TonB-dependent receptor [Mariniphaga sediminis]